MKIDQSLVALLLLLLRLSTLASCLQELNVTGEQAALSKLVTSLPSCMTRCAIENAPPDCPLGTMKCVCRPTNKATQNCSIKQCKGWDLVVGQKLILEACGVPLPREDIPLMAQLWASTAICILVLGMCIAARIYGGQGGIGWDDACVTFAVCCLVITVSGTQVAVKHGMGHAEDIRSPDDIMISTRWFFIRSIFFFWTAAACKASLLFQFARIFTSNGAEPVWQLPYRGPAWSFKMVLLFTHMVNLISCIAFSIFALAQCYPMSFYWTQWNSPKNGYCIVNKRYPSFGHSVVGVLLDFWILVLPLTLISTLNMSKGTKIAAASMYCLGTLVTVISLIRVIILMKDLHISSDLLSNYIAVTKWSQAEMGTAIVCACIIPTKQFCFRVLPIPFQHVKKAFFSTRRRRRSVAISGNSGDEEGGNGNWQHGEHKQSPGGAVPLGKHSYSSSTSSQASGRDIIVEAKTEAVELQSAGSHMPKGSPAMQTGVKQNTAVPDVTPGGGRQQ